LVHLYYFTYEALCSFETSVTDYRLTWHHIPQ